MQMCDKCTKMSGALILVVGVLFLLRDLGIWNFWDVQWWTALFLLFGLGKLCGAGCPECKSMCKKK